MSDIVERAEAAITEWQTEYPSPVGEWIGTAGMVRDLLARVKKLDANADGLFTIYNEAIAERDALRAWSEWFTAAADYWHQQAVDEGTRLGWFMQTTELVMAGLFRAAGIERDPLDLEPDVTLAEAIAEQREALAALFEEAHRLHLSYDVTMTAPEVAALIRKHMAVES